MATNSMSFLKSSFLNILWLSSGNDSPRDLVSAFLIPVHVEEQIVK